HAQQLEQAQLAQHWQERLQRVAYEAHLAERQYNCVDPANRLVAAELERRWEAKLRQAQDTQDAHQAFLRTQTGLQLAPELCEQFRHVSQTLPAMWHQHQLTHQHKKALLRSLISQVILTRTMPDLVQVKIVWVSGHYSMHQARLLIL